MNDVLAAPARGLPSLLTALLAHAAETLRLLPASHFLMKEVLAAPDSGLPFLSIAWASQLEGAAALGAGLAADVAAGADVWAHAIPTEKNVADSSTTNGRRQATVQCDTVGSMFVCTEGEAICWWNRRTGYGCN